jgi:hypothetical protein|tara:strand:- start:64 stop:204 length:141 start_codon:yes stop_codon:yes gene_type:complete
MAGKTENVVEVFVTGVSGKIGVDDDSDRPSENDQGVDQETESGDSE